MTTVRRPTLMARATARPNSINCKRGMKAMPMATSRIHLIQKGQGNQHTMVQQVDPMPLQSRFIHHHGVDACRHRLPGHRLGQLTIDPAHKLPGRPETAQVAPENQLPAADGHPVTEDRSVGGEDDNGLRLQPFNLRRQFLHGLCRGADLGNLLLAHIGH